MNRFYESKKYKNIKKKNQISKSKPYYSATVYYIKVLLELSCFREIKLVLGFLWIAVLHLISEVFFKLLVDEDKGIPDKGLLILSLKLSI